MLVGEAGLCARYTQVLRAYDFGAVEVVARLPNAACGNWR